MILQILDIDLNSDLPTPATASTSTESVLINKSRTAGFALHRWCLTDVIHSFIAALTGVAVYLGITAVAGSDAINALAALAGCASFVLLATGLLSGRLATFLSNTVASALLLTLAIMSVDRGVDLLAGVFLLHAFWGGARLFAMETESIDASQRLAWSLFNLSVGLSLLAFGL